jgi:GTP 3',8-cyclase
MPLLDSFGRKINYLRLSVTDRCNLRCTYCMPAEGIPKENHNDILSYEEFLKIAEAAVATGIEKIRVTGGEPLVRKGIVDFLGRLAVIPGLKQLVLTTNGVLLDEMAESLWEAGVQRLNISLDSLRPEVFARVTRNGDLPRVLAGIAAAEKAGFPIKLNAVVMRGVNDDELLDLAALTLERRVTVRFIEYMPAIKAPGWQEVVVPGEEIIRRIGERYPLAPLGRGETAGPAREFRIAGGAGVVGIITPLSRHFCGECNRIRVTSSGVARSCLFCETGIDLKPSLRGDNATSLSDAIRAVVEIKPGSHRLSLAESDHTPFTMAAIGG